MASEAEHTALLHDFMEQVWNQGAADAIDLLLAVPPHRVQGGLGTAQRVAYLLEGTKIGIEFRHGKPRVRKPSERYSPTFFIGGRIRQT